jgi:hypothetical protein
MKYWRFIIIGLAFVFLMYYYFGVYKNDQVDYDRQQTEQQQMTNQKQWETQTDEQQPVVVKATPVTLGKTEPIWKFTVAFTTHSGGLDQDPTKSVVLVDDSGNIFQPTAWEGPGPGGHHREGTLTFNAVQPSPKFIELKVKDVGGILERSFKWNLE